MEPERAADRHEELRERFKQTRELSSRLTEPLTAEDYRVQSMPDVSPPWWNLGHTTWFFAKNILEPRTGYRFPDPGYEYALNSYYEAHGPRLERHRRGLATRPSTAEILDLRRDVDRRMLELLEHPGDDPELDFLVETGIQHEQQHQELLVTEIKHIRWSDPPPLRRAYRTGVGEPAGATVDAVFRPLEGGLGEIGCAGGWCWDNELPVHRFHLAPFEIHSRPVTVGEYLEFVEDGGYSEPLLWLANGWAWVQEQSVTAPLYWRRREGAWRIWTLNGDREPDAAEPVTHVSFYEADAYAAWRAANDSDASGARLPTEEEWEHAARVLGFEPARGRFLEDETFHPRPASQQSGTSLVQAAGDVWEWTSSHYQPYPGYRPFSGALMEYNGKFMDNQRVLRGGSCATPRSHIRVSYRNFWPANTQFQFTGLRLARSLD